MQYVLLLRNNPVLEFNVNDTYITGIDKIYNEQLIPYSIRNNISAQALNKWFSKRLIPGNRVNIKNLLKQSKCSSIYELAYMNHALSLSDQYWVRSNEECLDWHSINYFTNGFDKDVGNILFGSTTDNDISVCSPDITTNGVMKKSWRIKDGIRYLYKAGLHENKGREAINEVAISRFVNSGGIPGIRCAEYSLTKVQGEVCSKSKLFLAENIELVPASYLYFSEPKDEKDTPHKHLIKVCKHAGIDDIRKFLDGMMVLDFLTCNKDRHLGNFGFLRNTETMEFIGPAPLYDNGTSLWCSDDTIASTIFDNICKRSPFASFYSDQIKLVRSDIYNRINVESLKKEYMNTIEKAGADRKRAAIVCRKIDERNILLEKALTKEREIER